jgi:hypothetical protein
MIDKSENKQLLPGSTCDCDCCRNRQVKFLRRDELAARWKMESKTLANWASAKIGPPVVKIAGRVVRYAMADIEAFERSLGSQNAAPYSTTTGIATAINTEEK